MNEEQDIHDVLNQLSQLAPTAVDQPRPTAEAWAKLQNQLPPASHSGWAHIFNWLRRIFTMKKLQNMHRWAIAGAMVVLLAVVFSFPSARALASEFLGLFRVQQFMPLSISPEQLANLEEMMQDGVFPAEIKEVSESEAVEVASLEEAAKLFGQPVITIGTLGQPTEIGYSSAAEGIVTVNRAKAQALLQAGGVNPELIPASLDGADINITIHPAVLQNWENDNVVLVQTTSPQVAYPTDFDPAVLGQAALQLLGYSEPAAQAMAQTIDWNSTLVLPIPQEAATFEEVNVNGYPGLALEAVGSQETSLIWQQEGRLYFLASDAGSGYDITGLLKLAESLK